MNSQFMSPLDSLLLSKMSAFTELDELAHFELLPVVPSPQTQSDVHTTEDPSNASSTPTATVVDHKHNFQTETAHKLPYSSNTRYAKRKNYPHASPNESCQKGKAGGAPKKAKTTQNQNSQLSPHQGEGYIHVRARRGHATDSHSLAERIRREKISQRMKVLQTLVPGCQSVTGKALMLDEIINYIQSLQNQVEFLSMKLASVNPILYDFGTDNPQVFIGGQESEILNRNGNGMVSNSKSEQQADFAYNNMPPCNTLFEATVDIDPSSLLLDQHGNTSVVQHLS